MSTKVSITPDGGAIIEPQYRESYRIEASDIACLQAALAAAPARIEKIKLSVKHDDRADMDLLGINGQLVAEHRDGMPSIGIFGGDYTNITIDNATGKIDGWKPITLREYEDYKHA